MNILVALLLLLSTFQLTQNDKKDEISYFNNHILQRMKRGIKNKMKTTSIYKEIAQSINSMLTDGKKRPECTSLKRRRTVLLIMSNCLSENNLISFISVCVID